MHQHCQLFFSCETSQNIAGWWGSRQKGCITFVSWATFISRWWPPFLWQKRINSLTNHMPQWMCKRLKTDCCVLLLVHCHKCFYVFSPPSGPCVGLSFCAWIGLGLSRYHEKALIPQVMPGGSWVHGIKCGVKRPSTDLAQNKSSALTFLRKLFMLSGVVLYLFCIDLNPLQYKREGTQVKWSPLLLHTYFDTLKVLWCFSMASILSRGYLFVSSGCVD